MTRQEGNEILHLWRCGNGTFAENTINAALRATGDLSPPERRKTGFALKGVDTLPRRVWRAALAGGNSEALL